jgi:hypothetical protein
LYVRYGYDYDTFVQNVNYANDIDFSSIWGGVGAEISHVITTF